MALAHERLSVREKVGYGIGDAAANFIFQTMIIFQLAFYTDTFGITAAAGTLFLVVRVFDAAFDPLMGVIADRTNPRWGNFRPWILWGALPYGVLGCVMFANPALSEDGKLIYAYFTYTAVLIAYVAINTPYGALMGVISTIELVVNLILLVAVVSVMQATLALPAMAAIALTLGIAIDANVLINERIREELRWGATPHAAIQAGYERAWNTILDSSVTTLIAGIALFAFGSGPIRGFAVVHCLGILTSMFSAVMVSRAMVNLIYGGRRRLKSIWI
jgi:hypothetical protein